MNLTAVFLNKTSLYFLAPSVKLEPGKFLCRNNVSIDTDYRCDYVDHCGDYSDEDNCGKLNRSRDAPPGSHIFILVVNFYFGNLKEERHCLKTISWI